MLSLKANPFSIFVERVFFWSFNWVNMAGITLAQAETHLAEALAALSKARGNISYSIAGRSLQRPQLQALQSDVDYWNNKVNELTDDNQGIIVSQGVPTDD